MRNKNEAFLRKRARPVDERIDDFIKLIGEGWSVSVAGRKAGFTDNERYELGQTNERLRAIVEFYNLTHPKGLAFDWKDKGA